MALSSTTAPVISIYTDSLTVQMQFNVNTQDKSECLQWSVGYSTHLVFTDRTYTGSVSTQSKSISVKFYATVYFHFFYRWSIQHIKYCFKTTNPPILQPIFHNPPIFESEFKTKRSISRRVTTYHVVRLMSTLWWHWWHTWAHGALMTLMTSPLH